MKAFCVFLALGFVCLACWYWQRPMRYAPGVLISSEPEQTAEAEESPIDYGAFRLKPLAHFAVDGRLLHSKVYRYDRGAALVPVDLALGWGPMSDQSVLDRLTITQSMRFYWYEYQLPPPIAPDQIVSHSTNVHVIPATKEIAERCKSLRAGALVHLTGELVEATGPEIGTWRSSLSRTDTGNGACELMWVREISEIATSPAVGERATAQR
jgi:hypothetical protein